MSESKRLTVNSAETLINAYNELSALWCEHKHLTLSIMPGRDRTLEQNRLWWRMYKRVSDTLGCTLDEARAECKLLLGVLILQRDDEGFAAGWSRYFEDEPYQFKLRLMGSNKMFGPDGFPVTRLFNRKQGAEYTDQIVRLYAEQGVDFTDIFEAAERD